MGHELTLVSLDALTFYRLDKQGNPKEPLEWSKKALRQVSKAWPKVLIFNDVSWTALDRHSKKDTNLFDLAKRMRLRNVNVVLFDEKTTLNRTELYKRILLQYGGKIKTAINPFDIQWFNINLYIENDYLVFVYGFNHKKAKVDPDKPLTITELSRKREDQSFW